MTRAREVSLPDGRAWLRVAEPEWVDPLDASHAATAGGRWNPPGSYPTLYLNGDVPTARMQVQRLLDGTPFTLDDLDDDAYVLVAATLPRSQACADAATPSGLEALGLPASYPLDAGGAPVDHARCQAVGEAVHAGGLRGIWCVSAARRDRVGRELAWFPATARSKARPVWAAPLPLGAWRDVTAWSDIGLPEQEEPRPA